MVMQHESDMTPEQVLSALDEAACLEAVRPNWARSRPEPGAGIPEFLDPARIVGFREYCGFPAETDAPLVAAARRIVRDPALVRLARQVEWLVYEADQKPEFKGWPSLRKALGMDAPVFYLLVGLGVVPHVRRHHRALGIPDPVTRETCFNVRCFSDSFAMQHQGQLGMPAGILAWLHHYVADKNVYVRLGRFDFWLKPFYGGAHVYRNQQTREVLALAEHGKRFASDGLMVGTGTAEESGEIWTSVLERDARCVRGHPVTPDGRAERGVRELPLAAWECVLEVPMPIADMHIPFGGGMTPEVCKESFGRIGPFFRKHFPEQFPVAVASRSWMFSPELDRMLPPESNLIWLQHNIYMYPHGGASREGPGHIFPKRPFDVETAPRNTSLRRAFVDYIQAGNAWHHGAMFVLTDDLPRFGAGLYHHG